jgi:DNA-binding NtrC family response regulator
MLQELMQTYRRPAIVIFVSNSSPEATIAQDIEAHGLALQWAPSISAAVKLLDSACEKTVVATELALTDGNWRDLVERVNRIDINISTSIVLLTFSSTAELWWDALECGIEDIVPASFLASRLCQLLETQGAS